MEEAEHPRCQTKICGLSLNIGQIEILSNISLELLCHQFSAIIGPNGAGKSSLLRCLTGELKNQGVIYFKDKKQRPKIGYVPQKLHFDSDNPLTALDLFILAHSRQSIWMTSGHKEEKILKEFLISVKAEHLMHRKMSTLSGGEQRRVVLALALAGKAELLLLDEPDAGVDEKGLQLFYAILSELKSLYDVSILIVSHNFKLITQYTDNVFLMNHGNIIESGPPEIIFESKNFKELFQ